jgi:hypothetical protein
MTTAFPEELTAAASGPIPLPGPETVTGLPQLPVAVALMTAWISGVALLVTQTASAMPLGASAKYTEPRRVSHFYLSWEERKYDLSLTDAGPLHS